MSDETTRADHPAPDDHEELGETTLPQADVDATDVEGDPLTGAGVDVDDGSGSVELDTSEDPRTREELLAELQAAEAERDDYLDSLKRVQAEFQNFRKRSMREGASQREAGTTEVLGRLIDVLDDFELAVLAAESSSDVASLRKGVEMVFGKLVDALRAFGLEKVGLVGVPFDPERHEAVQHQEADEPREEPTVVEVLRPGYLANGKVLRAAMVKVEQ